MIVVFETLDRHRDNSRPSPKTRDGEYLQRTGNLSRNFRLVAGARRDLEEMATQRHEQLNFLLSVRPLAGFHGQHHWGRVSLQKERAAKMLHGLL